MYEQPSAPRSRGKIQFVPSGSRVDLFDLESRKKETILDVPPSNKMATAFLTAAFAEDGKRFVTVLGADSSLKESRIDRWGVPPGDAKRTTASVPIGGLSGIISGEPSLNWAIAPDTAAFAVVTGPRTVQVWDLPTGKLRTSVTAPQQIQGISLSRSGKFLSAFSYGSEFSVWDVSGAGAAKVAVSPGPAASPRPNTAPDFRTWTSAGGKFTVEAQFVEVADEQVTLKDRDGKTIRGAMKDLARRTKSTSSG